MSWIKSVDEARFECSQCGKEFFGPPLRDDLAFYLKVELAERFCTVVCAERWTENQGMAKARAALR